ncbi:GNAT family N-acetyltransferase [Romboutsia lituseburensis]|uniref:GNAT family N-acetyltransferase n=1 Tax=Romboutsia lituseburensis TaxID=1537 RepID=UPI00215AABDE|nr:GNAT family N-acetyltransferase [Romboutsia lituseburensis]MCR8745576.1 GNAT family N-acetyltransferase [Romboutsia lituseburensis]
MIKSYSNLNEQEIKKVYEFMKLETNLINSIDQMNGMFNENIYDYGKGVLFYFIETEVVASLFIVLEVAKKLKTAYIHKVSINKEIRNIETILEQLIKYASSVAKNYEAEDIRIGISDGETIKMAERLNLKMEYRSLEMKLNEVDKIHEILDIKSLDKDNKNRYIEIYNKSFSDMPHGTIANIEVINNFLSGCKEGNKLEYKFIVCDDDLEIGFMEATIENERGIFDIGLCKEYRKKGYGKRLLETAIQFLVDNKAQEISLIVIEQNQVAYKMYQKRGFEISHVMGHWGKL